MCQTLLLFAQLLIAIAADRKSTFTSIAAPIESAQGGQQLRSAIASKLQQLTSVSLCIPFLPYADPITDDQSDISHPPPEPSNLARILRSAVLVLKLATLNVNADVRGHIDPDTFMSAHMLWPAVLNRVGSGQVLLDASTSSRVCTTEEQVLGAMLCRHCDATLRQGLKEPQANMHDADSPAAKPSDTGSQVTRYNTYCQCR